MRVLNKRVLIEPDPQDYQHQNQDVNKALKAGKLVLPEIAEGALKKVAFSGKIVGLAKDCTTGVKKGERVFFAQFAFTKIVLQGKELWLMDERDLYAVIED